MEKQSDDIGQEGLYAILRLILAAANPASKLRISLLGHTASAARLCAPR